MKGHRDFKGKKTKECTYMWCNNYKQEMLSLTIRLPFTKRIKKMIEIGSLTSQGFTEHQSIIAKRHEITSKSSTKTNMLAYQQGRW